MKGFHDVTTRINKNNSIFTFLKIEFSEKMEDYFELSNVVGLHLYGMEKNVNFKKRYEEVEKYWKDFRKPIIIEEMGNLEPALYCCTGIEFHNSIWATAMMGDFGTGMDWWWDRGVMDFGYHEDLKPLKQFFNGENLKDGKYQPQKWDDALLLKNRKIENFALKSKNKERVLGWVHNATFYWRNLVSSNVCVENLVYDSYWANNSCQVAQDIYGFPLNHNEGACIPRVYHEMYNIAVEDYLLNFENDDYDKYTDNYTNNGGPVTLLAGSTFTIKNLKVTGLLKKHWYRIDFYSTHSGNLIPTGLIGSSQTQHTNFLGRITPMIPFDIPPSALEQTADYAYKVTYLGHYFNEPYMEDTTNGEIPITILPAKETQEFLNVYPNPNNGEFQIECSDAMQSISIYSSKGEKVFEVSNVNDRMYKMNLYIENGTYLIHILTSENRFLTKQIIVL